MNHQAYFALSLLAFMLVLQKPIQAADVVSLDLSGTITEKNLTELASRLDDIEEGRATLEFNAIKLNSPGGDSDVAMQIGRLIRRNGLNTYVAPGDACSSACVYILIAGIERYAFGTIGVHRARSLYLSGLIDDSLLSKQSNANDETTLEYIRSMGVSASLYDAMESSPFWEIRILTDLEKRDWRVFGISSADQEILLNKMARNRGISKTEMEDILAENYDVCLQDARAATQTVFECADKRGHAYPNIYFKLDRWFKKLAGGDDLSNLRQLPHAKRVTILKNSILEGTIYLRPMTITETVWSPARDNLEKITDQAAANEIESKNEWWVSSDKLFVLLVNSTEYNIGAIKFALSTEECGAAGDVHYLEFSLRAPLQTDETAVYSGRLPFDYDKKIGEGSKCGTIIEASGNVR